jgi:pyrroline-5-carboxylate reductase
VKYRLGLIGGGNMGSAIARGAVLHRVVDPSRLVVADIAPRKRDALVELGCHVTDDVTEAARSEQVILAVKPQSFAAVAAAIAPVTEPTVFVSIMAGLDTATLRAQLGDNARLVRVMPNTPCQLGEGMTGIALGAGAQPGDDTFARQIFEALGRTVMLDESLMHAVTAVSGSGPAYVYYLAELMQQAAIEIGLDARDAELLVVQTIIGAGRMLREAGMEPAALRQVVTTPKGTTAAALEVMERGDMARVFVEAITAARDRGQELGRLENV